MTNQFMAVMATLAAVFFFAVAARAARQAKQREYERDMLFDQLKEWEPIVNAYAEQIESRDRAAMYN